MNICGKATEQQQIMVENYTALKTHYPHDSNYSVTEHVDIPPALRPPPQLLSGRGKCQSDRNTGASHSCPRAPPGSWRLPSQAIRFVPDRGSHSHFQSDWLYLKSRMSSEGVDFTKKKKDSFGKTLMLGKIEGGRRADRG